MLDWSLVQLARQAHVSISAAVTAEGRGRAMQADGAGDAIRAAFEAAGVRFVADDGLGVTLRAGRVAAATDTGLRHRAPHRPAPDSTGTPRA